MEEHELSHDRTVVQRNGVKAIMAPDPEVRPAPRRRTFTSEYKLRILAEADRSSEPGAIGALLRREGLYSSHLTEWRRQRAAGELKAGVSKVRGRKPAAEAQEVARLQRENERLRAQLVQAELIIGAQKKSCAGLGAPVERPERTIIMKEVIACRAPKVNETVGEAVPVTKLCAALGFPRSTLYRERKPVAAQPPASERQRRSPRALSAAEKVTVREVLNSERFVDLAPRQVYGTLLDEGEYYCSVSSMYRILGEHDEVNERRQQRAHPTYTRPELLATAPNQVWSWDITWLRGANGNTSICTSSWTFSAGMWLAGCWRKRKQAIWPSS